MPEESAAPAPQHRRERLEELRSEIAARRRALEARLVALEQAEAQRALAARRRAVLIGVRPRGAEPVYRQRFGDDDRLEVVGFRSGPHVLRFGPRHAPPPPTPPPVPVEREIVPLDPPEAEEPEFVDPETVSLVVAPVVPQEWQLADASLEQVDHALRLIDEELARLAEKERILTDRGHRAVGRPYRVGEYTLYARMQRRVDGSRRIEYRFRAAPTRDALPVPLPSGYKVRRSARTNVPYLSPAKTPR